METGGRVGLRDGRDGGEGEDGGVGLGLLLIERRGLGGQKVKGGECDVWAGEGVLRREIRRRWYRVEGSLEGASWDRGTGELVNGGVALAFEDGG